MQSPYKKVIVYDLETGGFDSEINQVTEVAMVVVDLESLKIEDKYTAIIKPQLELTGIHMDTKKEALAIFKAISEKDNDSKIPVINYKGKALSAKELDEVIEDIDDFAQLLSRKGTSFNAEAIKVLLGSTKYKDIAKLYFDKTYNPQALKVTHMSSEMLFEEGKEIDVVVEEIKALIDKFTIGNNKPILAGHNIKKFDNAFLEKLLRRKGYDLYHLINDTQMIDTLEWARLKWFDAASHALGVCCNAVGLTLKEAHRALPDTEANAQLLIKMLKGLRGQGSSETKYERRKFNFNF